MGKKVLIISSSFRQDGNSEILSNEFARGAKDAGNDVEMIYLRDYNVKYCTGCLQCQTTGKCNIEDDVKKVINKVKDAKVLVFASPIYYYCISGQLKTFLDRMNPLYIHDYNFRDVYLIAACADGNPKAIEGAIKAIDGWVECFDDVKFRDVICGINANNVGDINNNENIMRNAYQIGRIV